MSVADQSNFKELFYKTALNSFNQALKDSNLVMSDQVKEGLLLLLSNCYIKSLDDAFEKTFKQKELQDGK